MNQKFEIEPIFSNIRERLIEELKQAKFSILVAVAWFTDEEIYQELVSKIKEGINVELIISDTHSQKTAQSKKSPPLPFSELITLGAKVYYMNLAFVKLMHHKYCVIDLSTVISGSFNWTYKASALNYENIIIVKNDLETARSFSKEFMKLKREINFFSVQESDIKIAFIKNIFDLSSAFLIDLKLKDNSLLTIELIKDSSTFQQILSRKDISGNSFTCEGLTVGIKKINNKLDEYSILGFYPHIDTFKIIEIENITSDDTERKTCEQIIILSNGKNLGILHLFEKIFQRTGVKLDGQLTNYSGTTYKGAPILNFNPIDSEVTHWQLCS